MTVAFDTLRFSQRLTEAGLAPSQAAGAAAATAEAMGDLVAQLATKNDLAMLRQEMNGAFAAFRQEVKAENAAFRQEVKTEIATLRQEVKAEIGTLRQEVKTEIAALRQEAKSDAAALRQDAKGDAAALRHDVALDIAGMRRDVERLELRMTVKLGTMMAGAVALTAALVRLL
jgi:hypothetical protein